MLAEASNTVKSKGARCNVGGCAHWRTCTGTSMALREETLRELATTPPGRSRRAAAGTGDAVLASRR